MHGKFTSGELVVGLVAAAVIVWFVIAILRWLDGLFASKPVVEMPAEDELESALKIAGTPRPVFGTKQWMHYECKPVFCDAPQSPTALEVHDTTDPAHDARTCKVCNHRARFSGVSHRTAN